MTTSEDAIVPFGAKMKDFQVDGDAIHGTIEMTIHAPLEYVEVSIQRPDGISDEQWDRIKQDLQEEIDRLWNEADE